MLPLSPNSPRQKFDHDARSNYSPDAGGLCAPAVAGRRVEGPEVPHGGAPGFFWLKFRALHDQGCSIQCPKVNCVEKRVVVRRVAECTALNQEVPRHRFDERHVPVAGVTRHRK